MAFRLQGSIRFDSHTMRDSAAIKCCAPNPESGEIRRFLVGPKHCEITGAFVTPRARHVCRDSHPGETPNEPPNDPAKPKFAWPDGAAGRSPRSACIVITTGQRRPDRQLIVQSRGPSEIPFSAGSRAAR